MSEVRILLRWCLLVMIGLALLTCATSGSTGGGTTIAANPCSKGTGVTNRNAPVVCVDDTAATLSVNPDPITVHSFGETDHGPVVVHWWTKSGSNALNVEVQPGCVTEMSCLGGHCKARTLPVTERKQCKYDVWTDKHARLDPEIIIDPCCPGP